MADLTPEQIEMIERKRQEALERRKQTELRQQHSQGSPTPGAAKKQSSLTSFFTRSPPMSPPPAANPNKASPLSPPPKMQALTPTSPDASEANHSLAAGAPKTPPKPTLSSAAATTPSPKKLQIPSHSASSVSPKAPAESAFSRFMAQRSSPSPNKSEAPDSQVFRPPAKNIAHDLMQVDSTASPVAPKSKSPAPSPAATMKRRVVEDDDEDIGGPDMTRAVSLFNSPQKSTMTTVDHSEDVEMSDSTPDLGHLNDKLNSFVFGTQVAEQHVLEGTSRESVRRATQADTVRRVREALLDEDESGLSSSKFEFVRSVRDGHGHSPGHPDFDTTTIQISGAEWQKLTPAQRTYWAIKKDNYNKIIFYQQGDFYNLFGPDAQISIREFDFKYNPKLDSTGFNRSSLDKYLQMFASRGYAVMVVDQETTAETDAAKEAKKKEKKKEGESRVVSLQVTPGTRRQLDLLEGIVDSVCIFAPCNSPEPKPHLDGTSSFGAAVADTSNGELILAHIDDDERLSQLETLLMKFKPTELHFDRKQVTPRTKKLISTTLLQHPPFYSYGQFLRHPSSRDLLEGFKIDTAKVDPYLLFDSDNDEGEGDHHTRRRDQISPLKEEAFAALVQYLERLDCREEVLRAFEYHSYSVMSDPKYCQLDAVALSNLELLANSDDGSTRGSLLGILDACKTAPGKRLLRRWICHPLRRIREINARLDAVELLSQCPQSCSTFYENLFKLSGGLSAMGDVERIFGRISSGTAPLKVFLQFFKTCEAFCAAVDAMKQAIQEEQPEQMLPPLLAEILGTFPNLKQNIIEQLPFDRWRAAQDDRITLNPGEDPEMDAAVAEKKRLEKALEEELQRYVRGQCRLTSATYTHSKTERYIVMVSHRDVEKVGVPDDWKNLKKLKDGVKFGVPSVMQMFEELLQAERAIEASESSTLHRLQLTVATQHRDDCLSAMSRIAQMDCLISLASYIQESSGQLCRPVLVERTGSNAPTFDVKGMWHPFVKPAGDNFISNDLQLGLNHAGSSCPPIMLITGPNMGGKSTILRQVCTVAVMAQIGCWVPASECTLSPVDRIFTRIGARDNIMAGKSTFFVELEETSRILQHCSPDSLVILDELGRGTSTFDGYALAYAVLRHLESLQTRTLFSTHYHKLTEEFESPEHGGRIQQCHMACQPTHNGIVFLYKLAPGASPSSFGLEVARMAEIPVPVIQLAKTMSDQFQHMVTSRSESAASRITRLYQLASNPVSESSQQACIRLLRAESMEM